MTSPACLPTEFVILDAWKSCCSFLGAASISFERFDISSRLGVEERTQRGMPISHLFLVFRKRRSGARPINTFFGRGPEASAEENALRVLQTGGWKPWSTGRNSRSVGTSPTSAVDESGFARNVFAVNATRSRLGKSTIFATAGSTAAYHGSHVPGMATLGTRTAARSSTSSNGRRKNWHARDIRIVNC